MKRGILSLLLLFSILFIPFVSAASENVLDIFLGSSDSSMIFLRFMYGALIFIIFLNVSKKAIFKSSGSTHDKNNNKLASMFSLILAIFATRFSPESMVNTFGWIIMILTPLMIYYTLFGFFFKTKTPSGTTENKDGFSWWRFIFAVIATLFTLAALGKSRYLGSIPGIGGGVSELFFDINYFIFDKYLPVLFLIIPIGIILALLFKWGSGTKKNADGTSSDPGIAGAIIFGLLFIIFWFFIGSLIGGLGFPAIGNIIPSFGLGWLPYVIGAIIIIVLLILVVRFFPQLKGLFKRIPWFRSGPSSRVRIDLITKNRNVDSTGFYTRSLLADPNVPLDIQVIVSRRSLFWWNERIPNANLRFTITAGSITPANTTTDPAGTRMIRFSSLPTNGVAYLTVAVDATSTTTAYISPKFKINVSSSNPPSERIRIDLRTTDRNVDSTGVYTRSLLAEPDVDLPIQVIVSRRHIFSNQRLASANLTFAVDGGSIAPVSATTDATGSKGIMFSPPSSDGTVKLNITVTHPSISGAYRPPAFTIDVSSKNKLIASLKPKNISVNLNQSATFDVNVNDNLGKPISGASVNVVVGNRSLTHPFRNISPPMTIPLATTNASGIATINTPNFPIIGSFNVSVNATHTNFSKLATTSGTINVGDPTKYDLVVGVINAPSSIIQVNRPVTIECLVFRKGTSPRMFVDNATLTISPTKGVVSGPTKVKLSSGRYRFTITPESSQAGSIVTYSITASNPLYYKDATESFDLEVSNLSPMNINIKAPTELKLNQLSRIDVSVIDSITSANIPVTLTVTSSINGSVPSLVKLNKINPSQYYFTLQPTASGICQLNFKATNNPTHSDTNVGKTLNILKNTFAGLLFWAPNPSNLYQLLQIRLLNATSGKPVVNAQVSIVDTHPNTCKIISPITTNASGSFPTQIVFQPKNPITKRETHKITFNITHPDYILSLKSINMIFDPPGSPLGPADREPI